MDGIEKEDFCKNNVNTRNAEDTLEWIEINEQSYMDPENYKQIRKDIEKYLGDPEWTLAHIVLSHHDEKSRNLMTLLVSRGTLRIIYDDGC